MLKSKWSGTPLEGGMDPMVGFIIYLGKGQFILKEHPPQRQQLAVGLESGVEGVELFLDHF